MNTKLAQTEPEPVKKEAPVRLSGSPACIRHPSHPRMGSATRTWRL